MTKPTIQQIEDKLRAKQELSNQEVRYLERYQTIRVAQKQGLKPKHCFMAYIAGTL